jgi:hypothetical protein
MGMVEYRQFLQVNSLGKLLPKEKAIKWYPRPSFLKINFLKEKRIFLLQKSTSLKRNPKEKGAKW